nr:MAG TPA: hypothetical protein [Caudoviricetes sp.]
MVSTGYKSYPFIYVYLYDHPFYLHTSLRSEDRLLSRNRIQYLVQTPCNFHDLQM